jgi:hypothetical protein
MITRTNIYAMCPQCEGHVLDSGEIINHCGVDGSYCTLTWNMEACRVYAFMTSDGHVCVVDWEDKGKVYGPSWRVNRDGHAEAKINGRREYIHNVVQPQPPGLINDHKHGERLDNRKSQLRPATVEQNRQNRGMKAGGSSSQFIGVYKGRKDKWVASIQAKDTGGRRRNKYLGAYDTEEEAARVYDQEAQRLYGEFAVLNNPQGE